MSDRPGHNESGVTPSSVTSSEVQERSSPRSDAPPASRPAQTPLKTHRVIKLGQSSPPSAPSHEPPSSRPPPAAVEPAFPAPPGMLSLDQTPETAPVSVHPVLSQAPISAQSPISSVPPGTSAKGVAPTSSPVLSISYEGATLDELGEELADDELRDLSPESTRVLSSRPPPGPVRSSVAPVASAVHQLDTPIPASVEPIRPIVSSAPPVPRSSLPPGRRAIADEPAAYATVQHSSIKQPAPPEISTTVDSSAAFVSTVAVAPPVSVAPAPRRMPVPPSRVQAEVPVEEEVDHIDEVEDPSPEPAPALDRSAAEQGAQDFEVPPAERKPPPPKRSSKPLLPQAQKARSKPWWETLFGDDFQRAYRPMTYAQLTRETDFIVQSLGLPRGSVVLDLGCGQGELCIELTRRGYSVVGYDLSVYQLAMAGDNAQTAGQKINFLQGDMREMAFDNMFDGILCWDTSFGYFEEEKNIEVLKRMKTALKSGGRLLLDILNRDFVGQQAPYSHWFEGDGCVCMDDMTMDWITNRLKVKRSIILDDGRSKELQYSMRVYLLSEIGRMLHEAGFRVAAVSGDIATRGAFFGPVSRRIIIEATKP